MSRDSDPGSEEPPATTTILRKRDTLVDSLAHPTERAGEPSSSQLMMLVRASESHPEVMAQRASWFVSELAASCYLDVQAEGPPSSAYTEELVSILQQLTEATTEPMVGEISRLLTALEITPSRRIQQRLLEMSAELAATHPDQFTDKLDIPLSLASSNEPAVCRLLGEVVPNIDEPAQRYIQPLIELVVAEESAVRTPASQALTEIARIHPDRLAGSVETIGSAIDTERRNSAGQLLMACMEIASERPAATYDATAHLLELEPEEPEMEALVLGLYRNLCLGVPEQAAEHLDSVLGAMERLPSEYSTFATQAVAILGDLTPQAVANQGNAILSNIDDATPADQQHLLAGLYFAAEDTSPQLAAESLDTLAKLLIVDDSTVRGYAAHLCTVIETPAEWSLPAVVPESLPERFTPGHTDSELSTLASQLLDSFTASGTELDVELLRSSALPFLKNNLFEEAPAERITLARNLAQVESPSVVAHIPFLVDHLGAGSEFISMAALRALHRISEVYPWQLLEHLDPIISTIEAGDPETKRVGLFILKNLMESTGEAILDADPSVGFERLFQLYLDTLDSTSDRTLRFQAALSVRRLARLDTRALIKRLDTLLGRINPEEPIETFSLGVLLQNVALEAPSKLVPHFERILEVIIEIDDAAEPLSADAADSFSLLIDSQTTPEETPSAEVDSVTERIESASERFEKGRRNCVTLVQLLASVASHDAKPVVDSTSVFIDMLQSGTKTQPGYARHILMAAALANGASLAPMVPDFAEVASNPETPAAREVATAHLSLIAARAPEAVAAEGATLAEILTEYQPPLENDRTESIVEECLHALARTVGEIPVSDYPTPEQLAQFTSVSGPIDGYAVQVLVTVCGADNQQLRTYRTVFEEACTDSERTETRLASIDALVRTGSVIER